MARKRTKLKRLDYQSPEYWERLLRSEGLSMKAGTTRRIVYVGDATVLDSIAGARQAGTLAPLDHAGISLPKDSALEGGNDGSI